MQGDAARWIVRVRDRGRDLVTHKLENSGEAQEIRRVYEGLGCVPGRVPAEFRIQGERREA
jgi:hypothetical protein